MPRDAVAWRRDSTNSRWSHDRYSLRPTHPLPPSGADLVHPQAFDKATLTARCLLPTPFTAAEDGIFLCEAVSRHPYMESMGLNTVVSAVKVNVQYAPEIRTKWKVAFSDLGERVNVTMEVSGNPQPAFSCSHLNVHEPKYVRVREHPSPHRFLYEVDLPRVEPQYVRAFPCRATNLLGSDSASILIQLAPSQPLILSPAGTPFSDYYRLKWSAQSKPPLLNATVEVSSRSKPRRLIHLSGPLLDSLDRFPRLVINRTFASHITHLNPNTVYRLRIRTCNRHNCSAFSHAITFQTAPGDGTKTIDPRLFEQPTTSTPPTLSTTQSPSRIRGYNHVVKRCETYGFGDSECGVGRLYPSIPLFVILFVASVLFCC